MKKRNILAFALSLSLILGSAIGAFAEEAEQTESTQQPTAQNFVDMPNNWSTEALEKAVENGLLTGYSINDKQYIKADGKLTRAEMAAVMNKAFGATKKADMAGVTDVAEGKWYADHMAVSVQMGGLSKAAKMRPDDQITREEVFTILAKVFKLDHLVDSEFEEDYELLNTYADKDKISAYAKDRIAALLNFGYISGDGNKIKPQDNITRAEFAAVMNNMVSQYVNTAGEVTEVVAEGDIMVNVADVTFKDVEIAGDVILADGIGSGKVTFENVEVLGRILVRGGGEIKLDGVFDYVDIYHENANVIVPAGSEVFMIDSSAKGVVISGEGDVELVYIYADNNQVNTNKTTIMIEEGVTGTTSGSKTLEGGSEVESDADASSQTPPAIDNGNPEDDEVEGEETEDEKQEDIE